MASVQTNTSKNPKGFAPDITGHSLGGALAQQLASDATYSYQIPGSNVTHSAQTLGDIITFNSPGIAATNVSNFNLGKVNRVKHYLVSGDVVSLGGEKFLPGSYEILDFDDPNVGNNHLLPVLTPKVSYGSSDDTQILQKKSDVKIIDENKNNDDLLNSYYFTYFDPEYLPFLAKAETATQIIPIPGLAALGIIPPLLLFRGTVEKSRQVIGYGIEKLTTAIKTTDYVLNSNVSVALPNTEFDINGLKIKSESLSARKNGVKSLEIQGKVSLSGIFGATADFAGDNYIKVSNMGLDVVGSLSLQDINLGSWSIRNAELKSNTVSKNFSGTANILFPGGGIVAGSFDVLNGKVNSIDVNVDNVTISTALTKLSLQHISGKIENLADPKTFEFNGAINITNSISGNQIWSLDANGKIDKDRLTGEGDLSILGGRAKGRAKGSLDWNQHLFAASADLSILNGFITTQTSFTANSNSDLVLEGAAHIQYLPGMLFAGTSADGRFKLQYTNNNDSSDDFVAAYREIKLPFSDSLKLPIIKISTKVSFDGKIEWNAEKEIFGLPTQPAIASPQSLSIDPLSSFQAPLAAVLTSTNQGGIQPNASLAVPSAGITNQYTVQSNTQWLILNAEWGTSNSLVQVKLKSPDGKVINESDFAVNKIAIVNDLTDTKNRSVIISKPLAGTWSIEVVNPSGLDSLHYRAFRDSVAPTIELDPLVNAGGGNFTINYKAIDPDSTAKVSLFYSTDPQNFNGALIKNDLPESDGVSSYSWNAKELAAGDYYVYALIDDGDTAPVLKYAPGKVTISNSVAINNAPVASKPLVNASAIQDKPFTLALPVGAFTDTDTGDVLTYSATLANGAILPTWLKFNTATGAFTGTPASTNLGSLQVKVTATDKAQATASSTFMLDVVNNPVVIPSQPFTLQKATTSDIWSVNGSGKVKASLLGKSTTQLNEIGIFKVDATNKINGIAPGAAGFAKAAIESGSVVFTALPGSTTNGLTLSHSLKVNNGERLGFFLVANGSVEEDLKNNNFSNVTTSADPINPYTTTPAQVPLQVKENQGVYTLDWKQADKNLSFNFQVDPTPDTSLTAISSQQGQKEGEVLDLRTLSGQNVQATFTLKREAAYNDSVSFYKIDDVTGTVTASSGQKFKPGDSGYVQVALNNVISGLNLAGKNGQTVTVEKVLQGGYLYAPILMSNVTASRPTGDNAFTAFSLGNSDRSDHVRLLGGNTFGFEDLVNGGDKDFNDVIVQASFKTV